MLLEVLEVTDNEFRIPGAVLIKEWDTKSEDVHGRYRSFSVRWLRSSRRQVYSRLRANRGNPELHISHWTPKSLYYSLLHTFLYQQPV